MQYLSMVELEQRRERLFEAVEDKDRKRIVRETQWWEKFRGELVEEMKNEQANHKAHPEKYFMELLEVPYVIHWRKQLKYADQIIKFSDGVMRRALGKA